jgi:hypothetical protein
MATIERLDEVASAEQPEPAQREATGSMQPQGTGLDALNLGALQPMLEADGWTLEKLAEVQDVSDLITYKGIGMVRAAKIMKEAKGLTK